MKIILERLTLENFKGIKRYEIKFNQEITNIFGANATGKTTIVDAFAWLLFDKDSADRKTFDIKTLDKDGNVIHMLDHSVEGVLNIDDKVLTLKKTYKEQWTKKRGSATEEFSGHATDYLINDVPVKKKDYDERIAGIIDEQIFKLLTNPKHFSEVLDKKTRRETLLALVDEEVDINSVIEKAPGVEIIKDKLGDYTVDELEKMAKSTIKKSNEELKTIPARIDELSKMKVEEKSLDALEIREESLVAGIKKLDADIASGSNTEAVQEKKSELLEVKAELMSKVEEIKFKNNRVLSDLSKEINHREGELRKKQSDIAELNRRIELEGKDIERIENIDLVGMRGTWEKVHSENIDQDSLVCPTCDRAYDSDRADEIIATFNLNKSKRLEEITSKAQKAKEHKEESEKLLEQMKEQVVRLTETVESEEEKLENMKNEYESIRVQEENELRDANTDFNSRISALEGEIETLNTSGIDKDILDKKSDLEGQLKAIRSEIISIEQNKEIDKKIEEHSEREKQLADEVENNHAIVFAVEEYRKTLSELLEHGVNSIFKDVEFKLFETQINGGITETCEVLIDGVPYSSANSAAKTNSGIEIINALSKHYGISAPIFVDNAESINQITHTDSQLITLSVSEDKELVIK